MSAAELAPIINKNNKANATTANIFLTILSTHQLLEFKKFSHINYYMEIKILQDYIWNI